MQKLRIHAAAAPALLLLLIFILGAEKAECLQSTGGGGAAACNATRVGDCLPDGEEFLMESGTSRRILQSGTGKKPVTYPVLIPKKTYCDRDVYGSCIGEDSKIYKERPCNHQNTCDRPGT